MTEEQQQEDEETTECGRLLRRTRERLGLSVADIASELYLSKHQIQALEEDDWDRLPGNTYARGYLRSYARLLNLDPEELLAGATTQELEIGRTNTRDVEEPEAPAAGPEPAAAAPRRRWGWVSGIVVIGVLGVAGWQMYRQPETLSQVFSGQVLDNVAVGEDTGEPAGTAFARPGHEAATAASGGSEPDGAGLVESQRPATPTDDRHVVFQFEGGSWVDVRDAGGERLLYRSFQPGRRIEIEGTPPFRVFLGNARGVQVEYSGEVMAPEPPSGRRFARFTVGAVNG